MPTKRPGRRPIYTERTGKIAGRAPVSLLERLVTEANYRNSVEKRTYWTPARVLVDVGLVHYNLGHLRRTEEA